MHELGHVFGLPHTFNNAHIKSENCLINPAGCAETINQKNCNEDINAPKTCEVEGDGFCMTPADYVGITFGFPGGDYTKDRCGVSFPTNFNHPNWITLSQNYMSYIGNSGNQYFFEDQTDHMHGYINSNYQNTFGNWNNCNNLPLTNPELGIFYKYTIYENQTVDFKNGINAINCNIFFKNCIVKLEGGINLNNSMFFFDHNTIFQAGVVNECTGLINSKWSGISVINSSILGWSGTIKDAINPAIWNGPGSSNLVWLSDVDIIGNTDAIYLNGNSGLIISHDSNISGAIRKYNTNVYNGFYAYFAGAHIYDSKISAPALDLFTIGIDLINSNLTFENSQLSNFGLGIISPGEGVIIKKSNFKSIGDVAISATDNSLFFLQNSFLTNTYAYVVNPTSHVILNNKFQTSPNYGLYLSNQDDVPHAIQNNIFSSNILGLRTQGKQTGLKMLCNKMSNTSTNFQWQNDVSPIQGKDIGISSGNLFENNATHIAGSSSAEIRYYYNEDILTEEPINVTHNNLRKFPIILDAQCGPIGPDWTPPPGLPPGCPTGIDCTQPCPVGIDCTQPCPTGINCLQPCPSGIICTTPCPVGIDCTQPCPLGINCTIPCPTNMNCTPVNTEACPEGIDCTQPCPLGINCNEPCPPGIDCTQPCPQGINCLEPCPLGVDCYTACPSGIDCTQLCPPGIDCTKPCNLPDGCHEPCFACITNTDTIIRQTDCHDPLMTFLNTKYQTVHNEYLSAANAYRLKPSYSVLSNLLSNQSIQNKTLIKSHLQANPDLLGQKEMKMIFENSTIYTESEVVSLIKLNPALLMDANIANVIFNSQSFSQASMDDIKLNFGLNQNSPMISYFSAVDNKKGKVYRLLDYVLYRLTYLPKNHCSDYITWLSRYETLSAKFRLIDHYTMYHQPSDALNVHLAIMTNPAHTVSQKSDAILYKQITDIITAAFDSQRNLNQFTSQEQNQLLSIANGAGRFSKSKARGILTALYDHQFDEFAVEEQSPERIYFLGQQLEPRSFHDTELKVYPNPAAETVQIDIRMDGDFGMKLVNLDGRTMVEASLHKGSNVIDIKHLSPGVYYYTIQSADSQIKKTDKLIIIR